MREEGSEMRKSSEPEVKIGGKRRSRRSRRRSETKRLTKDEYRMPTALKPAPLFSTDCTDCTSHLPTYTYAGCVCTSSLLSLCKKQTAHKTSSPGVAHCDCDSDQKRKQSLSYEYHKLRSRWRVSMNTTSVSQLV